MLFNSYSIEEGPKILANNNHYLLAELSSF